MERIGEPNAATKPTRGLAIAAGVSLLIPASLGLLINGFPTVLCPFPAVTIIPAFLLERIYPLAIAAPVVLFFLWNPGLSFGESVPKRSLVLLIVLTVPSLIYFVEFWAYGVEYQGGLYTKSICIINVTWLAGLWLIWLRSFRLHDLWQERFISLASFYLAGLVCIPLSG